MTEERQETTSIVQQDSVNFIDHGHQARNVLLILTPNAKPSVILKQDLFHLWYNNSYVNDILDII